LTGRIELYNVDEIPAVSLGGHSVPLEYEPSAALAYRLEGAPVWDFGIAGFRRGDLNLFGKKADGDLIFLSPYYPGKIPVVFVHGTLSSPVRWAEMINEFLGDSNIANRYQFWFFIYNSGNPIALSAMHLREDLELALKELDPECEDAALRRMVVIGHSQGGLLTKMTVVNSGTRFWDNISKIPFEQAAISAETKDLLRRSLFTEPLPFVKRVVFIATPHRGSFLSENIIGKIGRRLITLPGTVTKVGVELVKLNPVGAARTSIRVPTSIENMDGSSPFLRTLSSLPIAEGVRVNSIIPVKGDGPPEKGNDGVVRYTSAHIEGVESERVVRSGHSTQSNPYTIEEVRRILYRHAGIE
jgi:pimeloyl-ACP methyl ester carboxylesterase